MPINGYPGREKKWIDSRDSNKFFESLNGDGNEKIKPIQN
jgi:hypothetical protein